ncbi:hypothetical protein F4774DRAFT_366068 [Daldinia eschscholtzii]|nr:hypothetical protein F4774DRAFT_366068 [Daldinia eschscholtzii]
MGNQLSTEAKAEFDGAEGDPDLSPSNLSRPPYAPQSPEIVFSSQVAPSAKRLPPSPTRQPFNQPDIDMSSSPTAMASKPEARVEIPESPDYKQQLSTPVPGTNKSKKRRRGNRPSLISQPRFLDSDDARDNGTGVNGSSPASDGFPLSVRQKRKKRNETRRKKASLGASPDLGNLEMPSDPIESVEADEIQETQRDPPFGFRAINNAATESTPSSTSLSKKRKTLGEPSKDRKRQKRSSNGNPDVDSATSFSGLAKSLYAGRRKNKKALEAIEDDSMDTSTSEELSENPRQEYMSHDSSVSGSNTNNTGLNSGRTVQRSEESNELEIEPSEKGSSSANLSSNSTRRDDRDEVVINRDNKSEDPESDESSDDSGEQESTSASDSTPQIVSKTDTINGEYQPNASEPIQPKQGSARKRVAKPTFFEREAEGHNNGLARPSSSSTTGKKQAKISSMLQGNEVDSPTPNKLASKHRTPQKATQVHELVTGQFSEFEIRNITQAVERWRDDHNLTQSEVNDLIQGNPREVKSQEFWARVVATCPNRRRQKVINQCRRKFHNFVARGAWTPEQHDELKKMWEIHGSKYAVIGKLINRHPEDVRDRIRNYVVCGENRRVDPWTYDEEEKLRSIISEAVKTIRQRRQEGHIVSDESDEDLIDWQRVSELMDRTRSRLQCMQKWKLMQKQAHDGIDNIDGVEVHSIPQIIQKARDEAEAMSNQDRYSIVKAIRAFDINADGRIPWAKVRTKKLGDRWSRPTIMLAWYRLKRSVPDHAIMTVPEIIKQLTIKYHETKELNFPSDEDYDQDAEYSEIERKINKILTKAQRTAKTPATVAKTDDDEADEDDEGNGEIADNDKESSLSEESREELAENDEEIQQSEREENDTENGSSKVSRDGGQRVMDSDVESDSSDQSEDEELPDHVGTGLRSDDKADLGNNAEEDGNSQPESSIGTPSISNVKSQRSLKRQKRYSSSSKATPSRTPVSSKRKFAKRLDKSSVNKPVPVNEDEPSSDTNASEVESIPAHL